MNVLLHPPQTPDSPDTDDHPDGEPDHPSDGYMCPGCMGLYARVHAWPTLPWSDMHVQPSPIVGQMQAGQIVPLQHPSDAALSSVLVAAWCPDCYTLF